MLCTQSVVEACGLLRADGKKKASRGRNAGSVEACFLKFMN